MAIFSKRNRALDAEYGEDEGPNLDFNPRQYRDMDIDIDREENARMVGTDRVTFSPNARIVDIDWEDVGQQPAAQEQDDIPHSANLAEFMDQADLDAMADDLLDKIDHDERSREPWEEKLKKGLELLGLEDTPEEDIVGVSCAQYPLIAEAVTQFNARALAELQPPGGPVKGVVMGETSDEVEEQRDRVVDYMNYHLTQEDESYFEQTDRLLSLLPWHGSVFKKVYYDHLLAMPVSRLVEANDLIVTYSATSLEDAPRYTHRFYLDHNELVREQAAGVYVDEDLVPPTAMLGKSEGGFNDMYDSALGIEQAVHEDDYEHCMMECHTYLDLPDFPDLDEEGYQTGVAVPYVVTMERYNRRVVGIRRNWRRTDAMKRKRVWFPHYRFLPGPKFYGLGYIHLIGNLARATTDTLRAMLDSAAFANMNGGFVSKEISQGKDTSFFISPGEWIPIDAMSDDLQKSFFSPQYRDPSQAMYHLFGLLVDAGRSFTSSTEVMTGEGDNKGPVGTTVALIEQGTKVHSGIHLRAHKTQGKEFRLLAELHGEYLPEGGYPYEVEGASRTIYAEDFDSRVDIVPVSDPNISSATMRIAQAQAVQARADARPDLYDAVAAERRFLEAIKTPAIDEILIDPTQVDRMDPVSENAALLHGRKVRAFPDQDHKSHIKVHMSFFQGLPKDGQKMLQPALMAHLAEHIAAAYRLAFQQGLQQSGAQIPDADMNAPRGQSAMKQQLPPEAENQIAMLAARDADRVRAYMEELAGMMQGPDEEAPEDKKAAAEIKRKDAAAAAEEERKKAAFANEEVRKEKEHRAEMRREADKNRPEARGKTDRELQHEAEEARKERDLKRELANIQAEAKAASGGPEGGSGAPTQPLVPEGQPKPPDWRTLMEGEHKQNEAMFKAVMDSLTAQARMVAEAVRASEAASLQLATVADQVSDAIEVIAAPRAYEFDENGMPKRMIVEEVPGG